MTRAFYNEIDPYAAAWLRNLISAGHITPGVVDERSIVDLRSSDLDGFDRVHFFAGIGVWDYALGLAGWPSDRPVWTGSCPCQPFSAAGRRGGVDDERHLWPHWHHLIRECRPGIVLGEQVASKDGLGWLDLVHADLEGEGYAVGAVDLCAAGVGAPHIRQRLWFVANAGGTGREWGQGLPVRRVSDGAHAGWLQGTDGPLRLHEAGDVIVGDAGVTGGRRHAGAVPGAQGEGAGERGRVGGQPDQPIHAGAARVLDLAAGVGRQGIGREPEHGQPLQAGQGGFWSDADWIACRDGKARPVESKHVTVADGPAPSVGPVCANTSKSEEILNADSRDASELQKIGKGKKAGVRSVRQDRQASCASQGRGYEQQRPAELEDAVRLLSSSIALAELYRDRRTAEHLRVLRGACDEAGLVLHPHQSFQEVWPSLSQEAQDTVRVAFDAARWTLVEPFPLIHGAIGRVGRLKGYGNAINAEAARAFIESVIQAIP